MKASITIISILFLALVSAGLYAKNQTERAAIAEQGIEAANAIIAEQSKSITNFEAKLAEREFARAAAASRVAVWEQKWKEAKRDEIVKVWVADPVPKLVRDRVCEYARCIEPDTPAGDSPESTDTPANLPSG